MQPVVVMLTFPCVSWTSTNTNTDNVYNLRVFQLSAHYTVITLIAKFKGWLQLPSSQYGILLFQTVWHKTTRTLLHYARLRETRDKERRYFKNVFYA